MRTLIAVVPLALGLALSACASGGASDNPSYATELDRLTESCRERGGILSPTGSQSGRPQQDNVCQIRGQPARAPGG